VPPALLLLALALLLLALSRPSAPLTLPWTRPTILLAIDVRSVETNRARVFDKLGVANAVELANFVRDAGLGEDGSG
jgi:hypothetical protein